MSGQATGRELQFEVAETGHGVSALQLVPPRAHLMYVLAHGAGAGMHHPFLEMIAEKLADSGIATLRYEFPYMQEGRKRPDTPRVLEACVRAAAEEASEILPDVPLVAGGKSMGGRMTSQAQAKEALPGVKGLVFLGFPLHPPNRPSDHRAAHLGHVTVPMLFLQGTRDALADLEYLDPVCRQLGSRATLHVVDGGDHSFKVLKRSGRTHEHVVHELVETIASWAEEVV